MLFVGFFHMILYVFRGCRLRFLCEGIPVDGFYLESALRGVTLRRGIFVSVNPFFRFLLCCALALWGLLGLCNSVGLFLYHTGLVVFHNVQSFGPTIAFSGPVSGFSTVEVQVFPSTLLSLLVSSISLTSAWVSWL